MCPLPNSPRQKRLTFQTTARPKPEKGWCSDPPCSCCARLAVNDPKGPSTSTVGRAASITPPTSHCPGYRPVCESRKCPVTYVFAILYLLSYAKMLLNWTATNKRQEVKKALQRGCPLQAWPRRCTSRPRPSSAPPSPIWPHSANSCLCCPHFVQGSPRHHEGGTQMHEAEMEIYHGTMPCSQTW